VNEGILSEPPDLAQALLSPDCYPGTPSDIKLVQTSTSYVFLTGDFAYKIKKPVDPGTLFELASCSKSFTALGILKLLDEGGLVLDQGISSFFPWFHVFYKGKKYDISIRQLLNHTSGIPWQTIAALKESNEKEALLETLENISGVKLNLPPGELFEYATVNYDILGAIIEKVSGESFEDYMKKHIFTPLELMDTYAGQRAGDPNKASGYKTGLFLPVLFESPVFRGNNPSAYINSNAADMSHWLKIQMGLIKTPLDHLIKKSRNLGKKPPYSRWYGIRYNMGWIHGRKSEFIFHPGSNPNYFAFLGLDRNRKVGFALMANSNSYMTGAIFKYIVSRFTGRRGFRNQFTHFVFDRYSGIISFFLAIYLGFISGKLISFIRDIFKGVRHFLPPSDEHFLLVAMTLIFSLALVVFVLTFPWRTGGLTWKTVFLWASRRLPAALILFVLSLIISNAFLVFHLFFPM